MNPVEAIVKQLELKPHPEGGYFRETYRSTETIHAGGPYPGKKSCSTCIYFLMTSESFSAFHRIHQDEGWHFYEGFPIELHMISNDGDYLKVIIGRDFTKGQVPQFFVPGGTWFAAQVMSPGPYALVGCTVAPAFDFSDFELGNREKLIETYPGHREIITRLTRI